ncbi:hypothetical protein ABAZ39_09685 [Azospirillum argentinense]|uniref:ATP-dependent endonuclease n=1 Tax=Azospirillum argentinense TaxID=2970906 RepID=A0A060DHL8_9PROT|nr:AAA family ATPase [Azospirillum argentinense]AIB12265.1 hypothetical protein ABAZ39_09685 [Azospirillum argentinense]EZQ09103.1 ATP-dependent endonuclease [Azospirillum argentinense]
MKITKVDIKNFRSIHYASFDLYDYTMLVGSNNAGKSTVINALRVFYDDITWADGDLPRVAGENKEAWIDIEYRLTEQEYDSLPDKYKGGHHHLKVRKYLRSDEHPTRVKAKQSNLYAHLPDGTIEESLFFGARSISQAKLGDVIYVPVLSTPTETLKVSGASPFRNIVSFLLKKVVEKSESYADLGKAFEKLNNEAKGEAGFLSQLTTPMNNALGKWGVSMVLDVKPVTPEDIVKNQIAHAFRDHSFDGDLSIDKFGHGFQRSVIYELIRLAPSLQESKQAEKKVFDPAYTLILFEEPEAFLHPNQQENMAFSLRQLGKEPDQQVLLTTHSPIFAGKAASDLKQIIRLCRSGGVSKVHQISENDLNELLTGGKKLIDALDAFVKDPNVDEGKKKKARNLVAAFPTEEVAAQEDCFRYQLWLDSERASAFFAEKVVICEGASEKALFNYLLENQWSDLRRGSVFVLDALGKYNFHRFIMLFEAFGIPHAVFLDGDANRNEHEAINNLVHSLCGSHRLGIFQFPDDLEGFLGTTKPGGDRGDKKPIEILKALADNTIDTVKLLALRTVFATTCCIEPTPGDEINAVKTTADEAVA